MVINTFLGFILPWLFAIYLIKYDKHTLLTIAPAMSLIAFVFNNIGVYMHWWNVKPYSVETITFILFNLGLYPIWGSYMIHFIKRYRVNGFFLITLVSLLLTGLEFFFVFIDRVTYSNGWNLGYTFLSYESAYSLVYAYFRALEKLR